MISSIYGSGWGHPEPTSVAGRDARPTSSHIALLNNTRAICITIKIVVKLRFEVELKRSLPDSRTVGRPS